MTRERYRSIPHLPGSRTGSDRRAPAGWARVCTVEAGDGRTVLVQEKLDGSCVCAAREGDEVVALGRAGDLAARSRNEGRRLWAEWVATHRARFLEVLRPGERLTGEWLALVHSTRYELAHEPFVAFDLLRGHERLTVDALEARLAPAGFVLPGLVHRGGALAPAAALERLGARGHHGALDPVEGAVWRVEEAGQVRYVAKFVRPGKVDGALLPEATGRPALWNWRPTASGTG